MENATVCKDWYIHTSQARSLRKLNLSRCVEESVCSNRIIFLYDPKSVEWAMKSPRRYREITCRIEDTPGLNEPRLQQAEEYDSDDSDKTEPNLIDLYAQTSCHQVATVITCRVEEKENFVQCLLDKTFHEPFFNKPSLFLISTSARAESEDLSYLLRSVDNFSCCYVLM